MPKNGNTLILNKYDISIEYLMDIFQHYRSNNITHVSIDSFDGEDEVLFKFKEEKKEVPVGLLKNMLEYLNTLSNLERELLQKELKDKITQILL